MIFDRAFFLGRKSVALLALILVAGAALAAAFLVALHRNDRSVELPVVGFIGDSYIGGSDMGGYGSANFTSVMGRNFGWDVVNTGTGGTGFVASRSGAGPYEIAQIGRIVALRPRLVVVFGSRNDAGRSDVRAAAERLFDQLRLALPETRIVAVGPVWPSGNAPPAIDRVRDQVRDAATIAGLSFVDPIAQGWFRDDSHSLIGRDRVHPTDEGHRHMAYVLGRELERLGALPN